MAVFLLIASINNGSSLTKWICDLVHIILRLISASSGPVPTAHWNGLASMMVSGGRATNEIFFDQSANKRQ